MTALLDLPTELISLIASHLDGTSAVNLAQVHSALTVAAEKRIWHSIVLGNPYGPRGILDRHSLVTGANPVGGQPVNLDGQWPRSNAVRAFFLYLLKQMDLSPRRSTYVRSIQLELSHLIPRETGSLLKRVGGSLRQLCLGYPVIPAASYPQEAFLSLPNLFHPLANKLPALTHVEVSIVSDWDETVCSVLLAAPNLEFLRLNSHPRAITPPDPPPSPPCLLSGPFPKLKALIVDCMQAHFSSLLTHLVTRAPNLEKVLLRPTLLWSPHHNDPLLTALGNLPRLHVLEGTSDCLDALSVPGAFTSLRSLSLLWKMDHIEEHWLTSDIVPALPNLEIYQIDLNIIAVWWGTSGSRLLTHPRLEGPSIAIRATLTSHIHSSTLAQLVCLPSLCLVSIPLTASPIRPSDDIGPASVDWRNDPHFRGLITTSYRHVDRGELVHCRALFGLAAAGNNKDSGDCMGDPEWEHHAWWNGKVVPTNVLAAVYAASGLLLATTCPVRGKELPSVGWDVLEHWTLHDSSWF